MSAARNTRSRTGTPAPPTRRNPPRSSRASSQESSGGGRVGSSTAYGAEARLAEAEAINASQNAAHISRMLDHSRSQHGLQSIQEETSGPASTTAIPAFAEMQSPSRPGRRPVSSADDSDDYLDDDRSSRSSSPSSIASDASDDLNDLNAIGRIWLLIQQMLHTPWILLFVFLFVAFFMQSLQPVSVSEPGNSMTSLHDASLRTGGDKLVDKFDGGKIGMRLDDVAEKCDTNHADVKRDISNVHGQMVQTVARIEERMSVELAEMQSLGTKSEQEARNAADKAEKYVEQAKRAMEEMTALSKDFQATAVEEVHKTITTMVRAAVSSALGENLRRLPKTMLDSVVAANLFHNYELGIRKVNFFAPNQGAIVDPWLTSPTHDHNKGRLARLYTSLTSYGRPKSPMAALQSWSEAGDCWCAASPSSDRQRTSKDVTPTAMAEPRAQLGVLMAHPVAPRAITVEHVPVGGTLDASAAPRGMELWVEVPQEVDSEDLRRASDEFYSSHPAGPAVEVNGKLSLGRGWVRIARFEYNLHATNHVQTFGMDIDLGISVTRAAIRATSNWGGDHTCFYRVRLHGDTVYEG